MTLTPDPAPLLQDAAPGTDWPFTLDRSLGVPLGAQLRGQIEYGIACGELPRGARLPSVRELSQNLAVAHVTVAQVYKDLLAQGLIVTARGRGTYVAELPAPAGPDLGRLHQLLGDALRQAESEGYSVHQVRGVLNLLLAQADRGPADGVTVLLVGLFADATSSYAAGLQAALRPGDRVQAVTLGELRQGHGLAQARQADVVLALAHRLAETRALFPGTEVLPVGFIPSQPTRAALAALSPLARLAVVATFEEFLPTFLAGVKRFAPHVQALHATHIQADTLLDVLDRCDVVVYATGSELVRTLTPHKPMLEYRHIIDPHDIERLVLPAVLARRKEGPL
ncbi:GntR family transcriptional regulator (plasmid) [Deinococcus taeanensis]|uniref:GntR family transcriptional regulator n=1 Tax=Deinococcus taeanensis TaxID=2737050 RepID=UPI001CDB98D5|nr:GntR family transcriptional regulator [Deinococcus taeanensis]UBV44297.1 GntR family transcriptional regulator [Deinococcus taeanensis]